MDIQFQRESPEGQQTTRARFYSSPAVLSDRSEFDIPSLLDTLDENILNYNRLGSCWTIDFIVSCTISIALFRPAQGSSFIPTPKDIFVKHCCANVKNDDEKCPVERSGLEIPG
jgi:hypothetical protein